MSSSSVIDALLQHSLDKDISISQLVKFCSLVADGVSDEGMSDWCEAELYGHEELPEYRKVYGRLTAQDVFNRKSPVSYDDPALAELYSTVHISLSIGDIEDMVRDSSAGRAYQFMFPDKLAQKLIEENRHVISVYWVIQVQTLTKIVEHVRNRIFKWAKELKRSGVSLSGSYPVLGERDAISESPITINAGSFNTASIGSGTTFNNSPVQVAVVSSSQSIHYELTNLSELSDKFDRLLSHLDAEHKTPEIEQLIEEIHIFKSLMNQPKLKSTWISETLVSIRGVLENATGTAIAGYVDRVQLITSIGQLIGLS